MLYIALKDMSEFNDGEELLLREKIKHYFSEDVNLKRKDSVLSKLLLCEVLKEKFNLSEYLIDVDENEKPFIKNSDIQFNLSHSEKYALCVCGYGKVGCDIQIIKEFNEKISKRFFTEKEHKMLLESENKDLDFTRLWTLKESVLKCIGTGISGGLDSFDFSEYYKQDEFSAYGFCFKTELLSGYVQSVCSESREICNCSSEINFEKFRRE